MIIAELDQMSQMEMKEVDKTELVDIQTVRIDPLQSAAKRMESYLEQIKNPYCFLCSGSVVRVRFEDSTDLTNKLENFYIRMKKG